MSREIEADKALLLTTGEMQSNRWHHEREKLRLFPSFALVGRDGQVIAAVGALDTQYDNSYGVRLDLSHYPHGLPKIYPNGWSLHPDAPHRYNDGSLCVMRADQWRSYFTIALTVAKTAIWLNKYELWKRNGHHWPGLGQRH